MKHNAVLGIQTLFHRIQCFLGKAFLHADSGNDAEALRLNENLSLFAFMGANLLGGSIISTKEPFSVPASVQNGLVHFIHSLLRDFCLFFLPNTSADFRKLISIFHVHTCNKHRLCNWSLGRPGSLERLSRLIGEAVQVQAVVPVCPSDQRKLVRSKMGAAVLEGTAQMLKQGCCFFHMTVKGNHLV